MNSFSVCFLTGKCVPVPSFNFRALSEKVMQNQKSTQNIHSLIFTCTVIIITGMKANLRSLLSVKKERVYLHHKVIESGGMECWKFRIAAVQ